MHPIRPPPVTKISLVTTHQALTALLTEQMTSQVPSRLPFFQFPAIKAPNPDFFLHCMRSISSSRGKRDCSARRVHGQRRRDSSASIALQRWRGIRAKPAVDAEPILGPRFAPPSREPLHRRLRGRKILLGSQSQTNAARQHLLPLDPALDLQQQLLRHRDEAAKMAIRAAQRENGGVGSKYSVGRC